MGPQLWPEIWRAAGRSGKRYLACAYAGRHAAELIPLSDGDVVVVDASQDALKAGQTSPDAIAKSLGAQAPVYSHPGLHAKAYLLGGCAFIGPANASRHSEETLVERCCTQPHLRTDRRGARSGV